MVALSLVCRHMSSSLVLRLLGVAAFTAAPAAAVGTNPTPSISTGNALAIPANGGVQNTGGNVEIGKGSSTSTVVTGSPAPVASLAPTMPAVVPKTAVAPANPSADAVARARALVAAAKARADAEIAAARARAQQAVDQARATADQAQSRAQSQSDAARASAQSSSASSNR